MSTVLILSTIDPPSEQQAYFAFMDDVFLNAFPSATRILSPGATAMDRLILAWAIRHRHLRVSRWASAGKRDFCFKKDLEELLQESDKVMIVGDPEAFPDIEKAFTCQVPRMKRGCDDPPPDLPGQLLLFPESN